MIDHRITRRAFARAVLVGAVEPNPRPVALNVLVAQMYAESGPARCDGADGARYNPLNTTLFTLGSEGKEFNSVGVQNYLNVADGIAATISTLREPAYATVRAALAQDGLEGDTVAEAIAKSPWGTGDLLLKVLKSYRRDPTHYDLIKVGQLG